MNTDHHEESSAEAPDVGRTASSTTRRAMFLGAAGGAGALIAGIRAAGAGAGESTVGTILPDTILPDTLLPDTLLPGSSEPTDTTGGTDTSEAPGSTAPTGTTGEATATTAASDGSDAPASSMSPEQAAADLEVAKLAASLEVLAVNTYTSALDAATAGALGEVPPAVAEYVATAQAHHQAALDAWNEVLEGAGETAVTEPPADLAATVAEQFAEVTDVAGAAALALSLEETASDTYLDALSVLFTAAALELAGSIQVVDMQHAAVLLFVLGQYPVPDTFANTELSIAAA